MQKFATVEMIQFRSILCIFAGNEESCSAGMDESLFFRQESVMLHLGAQLFPGNSKNVGRFRLVPVRLLQSLLQQSPFCFVQIQAVRRQYRSFTKLAE